MTITRKAPAKLNLGLHVLRRRPDGYHDLETVFIRIGWADTLEIALADSLSMSCDHPDLDAEPDNLCLKAARTLQHKTGVRTGARIRLTKRIPMGSGLGGGSSDAATTLDILNDLWETGLSPSELQVIGSEIGSDVSFFLHAGPAYAEGRGERLSILTDANGPLVVPYWFVVLKPDVHVSTAAAYATIIPDDNNRADIRSVVRSLDLARWRADLVNDFQAGVVERHAAVWDGISLLRDSGAEYAAMSGSGSAVFGVFETENRANEAAVAGRDAGMDAWSGQAYQPIRPF